MERTRKTYQFISIILFGCMLALPFLQLTFHLIPEDEVSSENRNLATKPIFDWSKLDQLPSQYDKYLSDHFSFRKLFLDTYFSYSILNGESPIPSVIIGHNDFLFSGKEELNLYNGSVDYFSDEEINQVIQTLVHRQKELQKKGISFYVAIAPTAYEIYPELLPQYIQRAKQTATDRFLEKLHTCAPEICCIYLKDSLLQHKQKELLYLKNDNHWNALGAYHATNAIFSCLHEKYPTLPRDLTGQFTFEPTVTTDGNLSGWMTIGSKFDRQWISNNYNVNFNNTLQYKVEKDTIQNYEPTPGFPYPWEFEQEFYTHQKDRPTIVVIRDSYSNAIIPFMAPFFNHSLFIFDAWEYGDNKEIIQNEQPDIVLYIIYEPHIRNIVRKSK